MNSPLTSRTRQIVPIASASVVAREAQLSRRAEVEDAVTPFPRYSGPPPSVRGRARLLPEAPVQTAMILDLPLWHSTCPREPMRGGLISV